MLKGDWMAIGVLIKQIRGYAKGGLNGNWSVN